MRITSLLVAAGAALLTACASTTELQMPQGSLLPEVHVSVPRGLGERLAQTPDCCASLAELPYRDLPVARKGTLLHLDESAPAFAFEGGKSYFAAFRLPAEGRPLILGVTSFYRGGLPGRFLLELDMSPLLFRPAVLVLDDRFRVRRTIAADWADNDRCRMNMQAAVYRLSIEISEPPSEAAYVVIATTDDLRRRDGERVCDRVQHGFSPIGDVGVSLEGLDVDDGRIALSAWAEWAGPGAKPITFWEYLLDESREGHLVLGEGALHFVPARPSAATPRMDFATQQVVTATFEGGVLVVGVVAGTSGEVQRHRFRIGPSAGAKVQRASGADFSEALSLRIRPDARVDRIDLAVLPWEPSVEFMVRVDPADQTAQSRIFDKAMSGGLVVAMPCGLCQTGLCPPQALLPCAALFAAGAVIGGAFGTIEELSSGGLTLASPPPDAAAAEAKRAAVAPVSSVAGRRLAQGALQRCVQLPWDEAARQGWREQGRSAQLVSALAPAGARAEAAAGTPSHRAEVSLTSMALVASGDALPLDARIVVDGFVRYFDRTGTQLGESKLAWQSDAMTLERLSEPDSPDVRDALDAACESIGRQAVEAVQALWSGH
jgi:hypothetical protein